MFKAFIAEVREIYQTDDFIPLHAPSFQGHEKKYLLDIIDSTFVSSVGAYVDRFESDIAQYTGAAYAVATMNGTAALHMALLLAGVSPGDEVITQSLTFVATCNAIRYCNADPVFIDVNGEHLGLSPQHLAEFLQQNAEVRDGICRNKTTGRQLSACVPMHTFGHSIDMGAIQEICKQFEIPVIEDAAESLGSTLHDKHTGTTGCIGVLSFNGNKIITTGGGGMIITNDEQLAIRAKHLTTTAKLAHAWQYEHDEIGYNYRMPNLNAALGVAQLEQLPEFLMKKRALASHYQKWCAEQEVQIVTEPNGACSNYWLNALVLKNREERDQFLEITNNQGIMTRPLWEPMHRLPMFMDCQRGPLDNTEWLMQRLVNIPSSPV